MEFKSEFVGKTTQIKFEESKKTEEKPQETANYRPTFKKNSTFYHENEEIVGEDHTNSKKFLKSYESNL